MAELGTQHDRTPAHPLRVLRSRARVAPALQRRYRTGLAGGLALALVAGVSAAAVVEDDAAPARADLAALGLEAEYATTPGITVPETEDWDVTPLDVEVELGKADVWHLREAQIASRNAEREALEEQQAAEAQRQEAAAAAEARTAPQQQESRQQRQQSRQSQQSEQSESSEQTAEAPAQASEPQAQASAGQGGERGSIASMVNGLRGQNGLGALGRDGSLDSVAQGWAEWMASNQVLQHNPNYRSQIGGGWSRSGENIVRNTGAQSWSSGEITSWMFNWWSNSAPHRANMLNTAYTHVGVGYAMGSGGPYAVLVFGGR